MLLKREKLPLVAFQTAVFFSLFGINPTGGIGGEGSVLRQFGWIILAGLCLFGIVGKVGAWAEVKSAIRGRSLALFLLCVFFLYALASSLWSEAPFVTFKRALLLGIVMLICLIAVEFAKVEGTDCASLLIKPLCILLGLSLLFSAAFPRAAFTDIGWQGITGQKNSMGQLAAILVLSALLSQPSGGRASWGRGAVVLAGLAALALSRSGTALVGLAAAMCALAVARVAKKVKEDSSWSILVFFAVAVTATGLFAAYMLDLLPEFSRLQSAFFGLLGKSETFTGRTALWDLVLNQARYRSEWIGGGYGGFWDISSERVAYVIGKLGFQPIQAHNGYLEVFNDLGYVGLGVAGTILISYMAWVIGLQFKSGESRDARFHLALCVYLVLVNFSESSLFRTTQFLNLLFLASFLAIAGRKCVKQSEDIPGLPRKDHRALDTNWVHRDAWRA